MLRYFCVKQSETNYSDFFINGLVYSGGLVCSLDEDVYVIEFTESTKYDFDYVGWRNTEDDKDKVGMIFKNVVLLGICFPYPLHEYIERGDGEIVYLKVNKIKKIGPAKNVKQEDLYADF